MTEPVLHPTGKHAWALPSQSQASTGVCEHLPAAGFPSSSASTICNRGRGSFSSCPATEAVGGAEPLRLNEVQEEPRPSALCKERSGRAEA